MPPDDPYELRAALAGDARAWAAIVDEFSTTMWHWARSTDLGRQDAEDVCQTVWFLLADRGHGIEDPTRLAGWLATTTRREALAIHRRRSRGRDVVAATDVAEWDVVDEGPAADEVVGASSLADRLSAAYATLRERCRELLAVLWGEELSYEEVSDLLGMPIGSIGPTRQRCLRQLRERAAVA